MNNTLHVNSEVFPNGYVVYCQDRCDGYGGVFVACRDNLATRDVHLTPSSCEFVTCRIQLTDHSSLIPCSVYRPPSSNELYLAGLCQQLATIQAQYPNSALWIAGDIICLSVVGLPLFTISKKSSGSRLATVTCLI